MTQILAICIGAQRAGTTWLADYLRAHPEVHLSPIKEVHYFDARHAPKWCLKYEGEMLAEFQREAARLTLEVAADPALNHKLGAILLRLRMVADPSAYMKFMSWGSAGRRLLVDVTPDYAMIGEDGFRAMRDVHDDVRLVFRLRNPADRFWSTLRFNRTHNPRFDIDAMFDRLLKREDFMLLADYGRTLRAARAAFGAERVHVSFYERAFTQDAVDSLCRFLGVATHPADFGRRSNAALASTMPEERRAEAVRAYARVYREIEELFPEELPENWRSDIDRYLVERRRPASSMKAMAAGCAVAVFASEGQACVTPVPAPQAHAAGAFEPADRA
jgi:hypothetical protein